MPKVSRKTKRKYAPSITISKKRKTRKKTKNKRKLLNKRKITKYRRNKMKGGMEGDAAAAAGAAAAESAVPDVKYIDSEGNEYGNEEEDLMEFLTNIKLKRYNDKLKEKGINTISQLMEHIGGGGVLEFMKTPHMKRLISELDGIKQKFEFTDSDGDKITMYKHGKSYIDLYINDVLTYNNILLKNIVTKKPKGYGKRSDAAGEGFTFVILGSVGFGGGDGIAFTLYGSEDEKREIKARLIEFLKEEKK